MHVHHYIIIFWHFTFNTTISTNHIRKCDETKIHARQQSKVILFCKKRFTSTQLYSQIYGMDEYKLCYKHNWGFYSKIFIFRGERIIGDCIKSCKARTCKVMKQKHGCHFSLLKNCYHFSQGQFLEGSFNIISIDWS
jgi:hypothetical protein